MEETGRGDSRIGELQRCHARQVLWRLEVEVEPVSGGVRVEVSDELMCSHAGRGENVLGEETTCWARRSLKVARKEGLTA